MIDELTRDRLTAFAALGDELHFTRAAARVHVAQPALSKRIQQLERAIGLRLFARSRRGVQLTPAGDILLAYARQVLSATDALAVMATRLRAGETGRLRVGFTPSAPHHVLPA